MTQEIIAKFIAKALQRINPDARWQVSGQYQYENIEWHSKDIPKPSKEQVLAKVEELSLEWEATEYQRLRQPAYPRIETQLDMLYHDIKNGTLDSGQWISAIEAIKQQFPK